MHGAEELRIVHLDAGEGLWLCASGWPIAPDSGLHSVVECLNEPGETFTTRLQDATPLSSETIIPACQMQVAGEETLIFRVRLGRGSVPPAPAVTTGQQAQVQWLDGTTDPLTAVLELNP